MEYRYYNIHAQPLSLEFLSHTKRFQRVTLYPIKRFNIYLHAQTYRYVLIYTLESVIIPILSFSNEAIMCGFFWRSFWIESSSLTQFSYFAVIYVLGGEPDPGFLATGTKLDEQFSCLYFDRYMSID